VLVQHLVSSLSLGDCSVHRLRTVLFSTQVKGVLSATLEGSSCTDNMTCTGGCGYRF